MDPYNHNRPGNSDVHVVGLTLFCFALKEEAAPFRQMMVSRSDIFTLLVGIGRQNAERAVRNYLPGFTPKQVFTCGFAGGLNPDLKIGDVVFETDDEGLRASLLEAGAKPAKIFCADRVAITVGEKNVLRRKTGADVVEMESAAVQAVCAARFIPCATVRVISDTALESLPLDFNALAKADKSINYFKLALAVLRSPRKIRALMELQKKTSFAAEQLAVVLRRLV